jgi:hypothetical protein
MRPDLNQLGINYQINIYLSKREYGINNGMAI